jgi:hypothetical protein
LADVTKLTVELRGLPELRKKLNDQLYAQAARHILGYTAGKIAVTAQSEAPTGIKVTSKVARRNPPRSAVVRVSQSGLGKHARQIHGSIRNPKLRSAPYTPRPTEGFIAWANAHGIPVGGLIQAIKRRGAKFQPFMRKGLDANKGAAQSAIGEAEALVRRAWDA